MHVAYNGEAKCLKQAIWEQNVEISSHILRKITVGPVCYPLKIKLDLLVVCKAECFTSSKQKLRLQ